MADEKITDLAAQTGDNLHDNDQLVVVDVSDTSMAPSGTDKNLTIGQLRRGLPPVFVQSATPNLPTKKGLLWFDEDDNTLYTSVYDGVNYVWVELGIGEATELGKSRNNPVVLQPVQWAMVNYPGAMEFIEQGVFTYDPPAGTITADANGSIQSYKAFESFWDTGNYSGFPGIHPSDSAETIEVGDRIIVDIRELDPYNGVLTVTPSAGIYFGGIGYSVTNGTFTIQWHANGIIRLTVA